jgi:hypothetical protein
MQTVITEAVLKHDLWVVVLDSLGPLKIESPCARLIRACILTGVARMTVEDRLTASDLGLAHVNIRRFIEIMKTESLILGHADRLDADSFAGAQRKIARQAMVTSFTLWPFWPKEFVERA